MNNFSIKTVIIFLSFILIPYVVYGKNHEHHSNQCSVHVKSLNFGTYNPLEMVVKRVPLQVNVRCFSDKPFSFVIKLIGGNSSNPMERYLYSPSKNGRLYYNLYYNSCIWGDGSNNTCIISGTVNSYHHHRLTELYFTIIGVIPPGQDVPAADDYYDNLQVIIEY